jgi:hypothetical protein
MCRPGSASLKRNQTQDLLIQIKYATVGDSVADPGRLTRLQDTSSSILPPKSMVDKIPNQPQRIDVFLTQKTDAKFSKISSGMFIPDP